MVDKKSGEIIQGHNEAPRSATVKVISAKGFYWMVTVREETFGELLKDMEAAEDLLLARGWKAEEPRQVGGFQKQAKPVDYVEGRLCPVCGNKLIHAETKDGRKFIKCSTNKWDFATKRSIGCKFVDWGDGASKATDSEPPTRDITEDF